MPKKKTQAYPDAFRCEPAQLTDEPGSRVTDLAKELGTHVGQIYNWRSQFNRLSKSQFKVVDGVDRAKAESAEIRRLKKRAPVLAQARVHPFRLVAAPFGRRQARLSFALSAL